MCWGCGTVFGPKRRWHTVKVFKGDLFNNGRDIKEDDEADYEDEEGASERKEGFSANIH